VELSRGFKVKDELMLLGHAQQFPHGISSRVRHGLLCGEFASL
jgi:hypothetical protein